MHMFFYCLTVYTSKKFPKITQNAAYFFPNSSQGPFAKIAGKGPVLTFQNRTTLHKLLETAPPHAVALC